MKPTQVRNLKDFKGPKSMHGIILQIREDAMQYGHDISVHYIRDVIYRFFGYRGLFHYMREIVSFRVKGFGRWLINKNGRDVKKDRIKRYKMTRRRYLKKKQKRNKMLRKIEKMNNRTRKKRVNLN